MAHLSVFVSNHRREIGYDGCEFRPKTMVRDIISRNIDASALPLDISEFVIEVFHMDMSESKHYVGGDDKLFIFNGHTYSGNEVTCEKYGTRMEATGEGIIFTDSDGYPIAEYLDEYSGQKISALSILVNLFNSKEGFEVFDYLMSKVNEEIICKYKYKYSWMNGNKEKLMKSIKEDLKSKVNMSLGDINYQIERHADSIRSTRNTLVNLYKRLSELMARKESSGKLYEDLEDKFFKELELIEEHDKISDITIYMGNMMVHTNPLYIHASNGKTYYGGKFIISINIENSRIRFDSDNKRNGFWTDHDPHPHVNGGNGEACLGNLEPTIIELLHQNEYYATVLSLIDFLESANTLDAAGSYVTYWDIYDEDTGEVIPAEEYNDEDDNWQCASCLHDFTYDVDSYTAYDVVELNEDDEVVDTFNEHIICPDCASDYYDYVEDIDAYANEIQYV